MNNKLKQFIRDAQRVELRDADRALMRAHFAELAGVSSQAELTKTPNNPWAFFRFHRTAAMSFGAAAFAILVTTSVAAAAEGTVPGDTLYPVKVHVTEEVRSAMAVTPQAKAAWETKRIERRLNEAEKVLTKKNDPATISALEANIATHTEQIERSIDTLERGGNITAAAVASSNLEGPLRAHKKILQQLHARDPKNTGSDVRLLKTVEDAEHSMDARRKDLEIQVTEPSKQKQSETKQKTNDLFTEKQRQNRQDDQTRIFKKAEHDLNISIPRDEDASDFQKPGLDQNNNHLKDQSR